MVRVRVFKLDERTTDLVCVALRLRDGTEVLVHEELPGFESFLSAAESKLRGMQPRSVWWPAIAQSASAPNGAVIFERDTRG